MNDSPGKWHVVRHKQNYGAGRSVNIVEYEKDGERYITGTVNRDGESSAGWYFGKGVEGVQEANRIALLPDKEFSDAEDSDRYNWKTKRREIEALAEGRD